MSERERADAAPRVVDQTEPLWFLGTLARVLLDGEQTGERFAVIEILLPKAASPPLHSHPQDETFYILDGEVNVWVEDQPRRCRPGAIAFAPGGAPHSFRVESDTARMLVLSTPAGAERYVAGIGRAGRVAVASAATRGAARPGRAHRGGRARAGLRPPWPATRHELNRTTLAPRSVQTGASSPMPQSYELVGFDEAAAAFRFRKLRQRGLE
jgi:quercetin dioxygenase-like cupin family protein